LLTNAAVVEYSKDKLISRELGNHDKESKEDDCDQVLEQKREEVSGEIIPTTPNHAF
jgi:hypothetical protein